MRQLEVNHIVRVLCSPLQGSLEKQAVLAYLKSLNSSPKSSTETQKLRIIDEGHAAMVKSCSSKIQKRRFCTLIFQAHTLCTEFVSYETRTESTPQALFSQQIRRPTR